MRTPGAALRALTASLSELDREYLAPHESADFSAPSRRYVLDVRAHVVLAHAEFEQCLEDIALWVLTQAERLWLRKKRTSVALLAMALAESPGVETDKGGTMFDTHRRCIESARKTLQRYAADGNHGISPKYLRKLYWSIGVALPDDAQSLQTLATWRGDQAHHSVGAAKLLAVEDVRKTVKVCLDAATGIRKSSTAALSIER